MKQYPFWSIEEVMEYLSIGSKTTMYKLLKDGFPHGRIGKKLVFRKADVDAWVEAQIVQWPKAKARKSKRRA